eukprot:COSAG01_NODE_279_length_19520_cov_41.772154_3_plen_72_part_00
MASDFDPDVMAILRKNACLNSLGEGLTQDEHGRRVGQFRARQLVGDSCFLLPALCFASTRTRLAGIRSVFW